MFDGLVLQEQRHLKWRALDPLEHVLMILCGICITGFSVLVMCDIVTRAIGASLAVAAGSDHDFLHVRHLHRRRGGDPAQRPSLSCGAGRIDDRQQAPVLRNFNRLVVLGVAFCMIYFGYLNFLDGFKSLRMPSMTPLASLYAAIPLCGALVALFTSSRWSTAGATVLPTQGARREEEIAVTTNGVLIVLMGFLFLFLGYMGVPVAFALIASVLVVTVFTPVSQASMIAQLFNGMDVEALMAVPFFLLVGDLMTSANVTVRMIVLSQTLVGHLRGGLAQVVTFFSMFFAGISGSSAADVAVLLAPWRRR